MKVIKISALWCPSCIIMNKIFNKLREEYSDIEFIEYDYDFDEDIVQKYNPGKILPVIVFEDQDEKERLIGEKTYEEIKVIIERYKDEENI